jgi:hypothetical protein
MSSTLQRLSAWLLCGALVLCAGAASAMPDRITFSEADLQQQLARRFPIKRQLLDQLDLQLADPSLRVHGQAKRLSTALTLTARDQRSGRSLRGRLALGYALRYEPADGSIRLLRPKVERFDFDPQPATSARHAETTQQLVMALAEQLLDGLVLYRVPAERLDMLRAMGFRPAGLEVTPAGLEITFEPVPSAAASAPPR